MSRTIRIMTFLVTLISFSISTASASTFIDFSTFQQRTSVSPDYVLLKARALEEGSAAVIAQTSNSETINTLSNYVVSIGIL